MRAVLGAPTRRGRAAAVLAVLLVGVGAGLSYPPLVGVGAALLVVLLAETASVLARSDIAVERTLSARTVTRGDVCTGRLRASGRRGARLVAPLVDLVLVELVDGVATPAEGSDASYPVPTDRRGVVQVGPLLVRRCGAFGLAARTVPVGGAEEVRVLPRLHRLHALPAGRRRALAGAAERAEQGGTDIVGLHEYVIGDDLRRLHWATSARTGTLMVREDADPADAHLLVLLDDRSESYAGPGGEDRFEEAVEVAYAVCEAATALGRPVHLVSATGRADVDVAAPGAGGGRGAARASELALVLAGIAPHPAGAAPLVLPHRDLDVVVAVTGDGEVARTLAAVCGGAAASVVVCLEQGEERIVGLGSALGLVAGTADGVVRAWSRAVG